MSETFVQFAKLLADVAGNAIRPYFGSTLAVEAKADHSPVTEADRAAEAAMRQQIATHFPDHGILGEEFDNETPQTPRYTWVLDPIDGTRAFIAGKKEWGTLIALCEEGVPILGLLDQPVTRERWIGARGEATTMNGVASRTGACEGLHYASVSTTSKNHFTPVQARAFVALAEQCRSVSEDGDCYAYGMLACGERDIVIDAGLKAYDILALVPIITGAGGHVASWDGAPLSLTHFSTACAAASPALWQEAVKTLNG